MYQIDETKIYTEIFELHNLNTLWLPNSFNLIFVSYTNTALRIVNMVLRSSKNRTSSIKRSDTPT